jgi:hypothetical protein
MGVKWILAEENRFGIKIEKGRKYLRPFSVVAALASIQLMSG